MKPERLKNVVKNIVLDATLLRPISFVEVKIWLRFDLQRRIAGLEGDAQNQDDMANQLEHSGKNRNGAVGKIFQAIESIPDTKYKIEAAKYRAEAAQLRAELAQIESEPAPAVVLP